MSTILPYTTKAYRSYYDDEFISSFTHGTLAKGAYDANQANQMVRCLNHRSKDLYPTISFNPEMLTGSQLSGGACSAIVFRLAKEVLPMLASLNENRHLNQASRERVFLKTLQHLVTDLEGGAVGNKSMDKALQQAIRTEQMALNTITVDREKPFTHHAVPEKIGAMASYYGLKTVDFTPEIEVKGNVNLKEDLLKQLGSLGNGAYFMRIIQKENNHKLETQGHSILYIKTNESEYYFDPALGCYSLFEEAAKTNLVYNATLSANMQHEVDVMSLHRLEEIVPVKAEKFAVSELGISGVIYSPSREKDYSLIIFSPALGESIDAYKVLARELSKKGFTVMCVDHPKTGIGVPKLQEEEIIQCGIENGENLEKLVELVEKGTFKQISPGAPIAVMGHSLGGSSSIEACRRLPKIKAAINLDGRIINPEGITQPVLQIVAKDIKEDRSKYNSALEKLAEENSGLCRKDLNVKHGDFSSPTHELLNQLVEECSAFFNQHLVGEQL